MTVIEYRMVIPYSVEEFRRCLRYMIPRQAKEMETSANGECSTKIAEHEFDQLPEIVALSRSNFRGAAMLVARSYSTTSRLSIAEVERPAVGTALS